MRKILFVINPISGDVDKADAKNRIEHFCPAKQWSYRLLETTGQDDPARIEAAIEDFQPDTVVAGGGDGTVNLVARLLLGRTDCRLGILPLGSANGLATELGIDSNVAKALEVLETGRLITLDGLLLQGKYHSFHLADIGYNAQLIQRFEDAERRGRRGYLSEALRMLRHRPQGRFQLQIDDHELKAHAVMITFANGHRYGTGAYVHTGGAIDDGQFEVCIFYPWPRWYLIGMLLRSFLGWLESTRWVKVLPARRVQLWADRPLPLQADGELLGETERVSVEMIPEKVLLWVPRDYN